MTSTPKEPQSCREAFEERFPIAKGDWDESTGGYYNDHLRSQYVGFQAAWNRTPPNPTPEPLGMAPDKVEQIAALQEVVREQERADTRQPVGCAEQQATEIIERIWSVWYGDFRGDMPSDRFAITLAVAKQQIIEAIKKCDLEMERVKACEHIAEGEEGWEKVRNLCPSTMAVAALRDKYEALLDREAVTLKNEAGLALHKLNAEAHQNEV